MAERMRKTENGRFYIGDLIADARADRMAASIRSPERTAEVISHGEGINRRHRVYIGGKDDRQITEAEAREIAADFGIEFEEVR